MFRGAWGLVVVGVFAGLVCLGGCLDFDSLESKPPNDAGSGKSDAARDAAKDAAQVCAEGTACDDGKFCTINDRCDSNGDCVGEANPCTSETACVDSSCDEERDRCEYVATCGGSGACSCGEGTDCSVGRGCVEYLRVFVTQQTYTGDFQLKSADAVCQSAADDNELGGEWMAWISVNAKGPPERFKTNETALPYRLVDETTTVAMGFDDFIGAGFLDHQINVTAAGTSVENVVPPFVWTGTKVDGTASDLDCDGWTNDQDEKGTRGNSDNVNSNWKNAGSENCRQKYRLYCFEQ